MAYTFDGNALVASLRAHGAWVADGISTFEPVEGMGIGDIATKDIAANEPLFHLPLSLLLTPWTSSLRTKLTEGEWEQLDKGWLRLIACMMWEESIGDKSPWHGYLSNMPLEFDSPMFWSDEDKAELVGTDIEERIGRKDADDLYNDTLEPVLKARPDLFPPGSQHFTLDNYHVQGSRILSRSFTIPISRAGGPPPDGEDEDGEDEEEEDVAVMVPLADMLNAAYERDNARLFADGDDEDEGQASVQDFGEGYTMITTKEIKKGEQIYNTYASPPNSELLRKYGHVDILALPPHLLSLLTSEETGSFPYGNAGDEVELTGDVVLAAAAVVSASDAEEFSSSRAERVDFWLEEGQEDTFGLTFPEEDDDEVLPPALVAFVRLLVKDEDWARAQKKGKLPKPNADAEVYAVILEAIKLRTQRYPLGIDADLAAVASEPGNKRNAAVVRLGEKRVLGVLDRWVRQQTASAKRKAPDDSIANKRQR